MSSIEKLQKITSLGELAVLLGYKPKSLSYILYILPDEEKYAEFVIPKKNGGERKIKAPVDQLKKLQKRLAGFLNRCFEEIIKKGKQKKSLSHGFRKNHSIISNANKHKNKRHVFNVDLQDFFPSINFGRVRGFFIKNAHFELNHKVATIIAQIACHENELPQGSPCSPIISNLIGHLLDIRMANLAKKSKCTYSRYVDDLTFSTNKRDFPEKIAIKKEGSENEWIPGKALKNQIEKIGFKVNDKKTSLQHKTTRQIATGLVVNEKVNIRKEYYKLARSMCHSLFQSGEYYIKNSEIEGSVSEEIDGGENSISANNEIGSVKQLEGILNFIYSVKGRYDERSIGNKRHNPTSIMKLYRELLFYKHFFSLNQPLIICEGKTDIVYLKCALKSLANDYAEFVKKNDDGFSFKISFLNLTENLKDVFAISEGTSGLGHLMDIYKTHMKPFKGKGKKHPVIILIDNDNGAKVINGKLKIENPIEPYYYFVQNVYIMHVPNGKQDSEKAIEDLFKKETLETKIGEKTFNRKAKIDPKNEYGKIVFAEKVVKAKQNSINFDAFKEVFNRFKKIVEDYDQKLTVAEAAAEKTINT
jgi:RNA-directed DNA polymerase